MILSKSVDERAGEAGCRDGLHICLDQLTYIVAIIWATLRNGNDFVGSKLKKIAVKMTATIMYSSCSEKMPRVFSALLRGRAKTFAEKWTRARLPTL